MILEQNIGVIQASKTGLLLYEFYSNCLAMRTERNECIMFADDTCLMYVHNDVDALTSHVNEILSLVQKWCRFNKLSLNLSKSDFTVITQKQVWFFKFISEGKPHKACGLCKIPGLNIDERINCQKHVQQVKSKLAQFSGITYKLKNFFNSQTASNYYFSCVYSVIIYCIAAWGGAIHIAGTDRKLVELHAEIVRNLFRKNSSYSHLFVQV